MSEFTSVTPSIENYWRAIILFGRNVASYKFALGKALLELAEQGQGDVSLDQLAQPFARNICEHLRHADKQLTSRSSKFIDTCRSFNAGEIDFGRLCDITVKLGFTNVLDAFHVVHDSEVPVRFFHDKRLGKNKAIQLTDDLLRLAERFQFHNLPQEVEARWRLVEAAWQLNLPQSVLTVDYDAESSFLVAADKRLGRRSITSCRGALNGYQKGKCFYCFKDVSLQADTERAADIDHFFPHLLKSHHLGAAVDGVWNLVLACRDCNRGANGKFAKAPSLKLLERLHRRNSFFIESHHPLRETLMLQTGNTDQKRRTFLQEQYSRAKELLVNEWEPEHVYERAF